MSVDGVPDSADLHLFSMSSSLVSIGLPGKPQQRRRRGQPAPPKEPPAILNAEGPDGNEAFACALEDKNMQFNVVDLGFYPRHYWLSVVVTFGDIVNNCFRRKSNVNYRFSHKLYNALLLVDKVPELFPLIGVKWLWDDGVFMVDKYIFGRLLGIKSLDGALFHSQGNTRLQHFLTLPVTNKAAVCVSIAKRKILRPVFSPFTGCCDSFKRNERRFSTSGETIASASNFTAELT